MRPEKPAQSDPAWTDDDLHNPHAAADKAERVQRMFAAIARSYDLNNRLHSMWRDQAWRRKTVRLCHPQPHETVLDVACGTGDLALAFANGPAARRPARVIGVDFTHQMVQVARDKARHQTSAAPLAFADGDALRLPLADNSVDIVTIAFGIRNVADHQAAIHEFRRVLKPGGRLCILEFSLPANPLFRGMYNFYFRHVMPRTATLISRDRSGAYRYLPQSVNTFIDRDALTAAMQQAGFTGIAQHPMTLGIAIAYLGTHP